MRRPLVTGLAVTAGVVIALPLLATASKAGSGPAPLIVPDSAIQASSITVGGGADPLPTTKTVAHFFRTALNPVDGVTYGFNMVGADPALQTTTTFTMDIVPITVEVAGRTFTGSDVLPAVLASPVFVNSDFTSTPFVTTTLDGIHNHSFTTGGALSSGNSSNQLLDATMRSQFNETGTGYHVLFNPVVHDSITIVVPQGQGTLIQTGRGVVAGDIDATWWSTVIQNLNNTLKFNDETHLPLYLTNNVMLFTGDNPQSCCIIGFHGASEVVGKGTGSTHGNGNQAIQTFAWASYVTPGFFGPISAWALQDIHAISHELTEWSEDPFVNNTVLGWTTPTAQSANCSTLLESGDPVTSIGFAKGTNTFEQGPTPNGTQVADGFYHPEDEVFMPWFMRLSPSPAQAVQTGTGGRYTLMGSLNPYAGFKSPATVCQVGH